MKKEEKNRGFRVPEGYFENLDKSLLNRATRDSKHGFKVPENYFDNFKVPISNESQSPRVLELNRRKSKHLIWMGVAASILLFFVVRYVNLSPTSLDWNDLEAAEIDSWIDSDWTELNAYDIAEAYPDVDLETSTLDPDELDAYLNEIELDHILYEN